MKINQKIKLMLVLLTGVALAYTACKKSSSAPAVKKSTVDTKTISSEVALNVAAFLNGTFGGFNFNDGLDGPTNLGVIHKHGLRVSDIGDDLCGYALDTTYSDNDTEDTTQTSLWTKIKLSYACTNGVVSGYNLLDSLNISATSPSYTLLYKIGENIALKSLNPQVENSKYSFNGNLNINIGLKYKSTSNAVETFDYKFTNLVIDPTNDDDLVSGSANFHTTGTDGTKVWDYTGTITFLGNHMANITINGSTYNVNLTTGVTS